MATINPRSVSQIPEPPVARFLFSDTRMAWFWIVVRLYAGYEWLTAGLDKLTGHNFAFDSGVAWGSYDPKAQWVFTGHDTGAGVAGFVKFAVTKTAGQHPDVTTWYAWFLQHIVQPNAAFFSYLVTFGEVAVGLGLVVGALTGIAAFFGLLMNFSYLLAGTVSINPLLGLACLGLVLAWRVGGYLGVDRYLLPLLGTPWTGTLRNKDGFNPATGTFAERTAPIREPSHSGS